jgi:hypothetical protein
MPNKLNPMCQIPEELLPPACISLAGNAIDWADDADAHGLAMVPVAPKTLRAMAEQLRRIPELEAELTRWQTELVKSQALVDALRAQGARVPDDTIDAVAKALRRAWQLGQTYWQQADSESLSQQRKSDVTQALFAGLEQEVEDLLSSAPTAPQVGEKHWTESEPVRLADSRIGRVYIAGPMTGIAEFNFPAFNAEAARLRAEGLTVLNPAEHGIVDGAEWADYLRHDIAGLASCERIHFLPGWANSKGARLEHAIAESLGMTMTHATQPTDTPQSAPSAQGGV